MLLLACWSPTAQAAQPNEGGTYLLSMRASGKCLDVTGGSQSSGALLQQWSCTPAAAWQQFRLRSVGDQRYALLNIQSGLCIEVPGSSAASGVQLTQAACSWSKTNQLWTVQASGSNAYQLRNVNSALCLSGRSATTVSGAAIVQQPCASVSTQQWAFNLPSGERTWPVVADGFASLASFNQSGTTGGAAGATVTVNTLDDLVRYATDEAPYVIRVNGPITVTPKGLEIRVKSNKTIVGVGLKGEIIQGGFFLAKGVHNVIIRNLTIRDTYVEGDPDGKCCDWDAIQMDGAHHVWIDHNHLTNMNDGLIDSRLDTTNVTVSWNILSRHNKAFGIGWTENLLAELTLHHNWFLDLKQRNPSCDNALHAHLYNNYLQNISAYGNNARGATNMVIENSVYQSVKDPYYVDSSAAQLVQRGSILINTTGKQTTNGTAFTPSSFYSYTLDSASKVPSLLRRFAGPQASIGN